MKKDFATDKLIIPVYINEKIVLDMLAIIEDGFSTVSQVSYTVQKDTSSDYKAVGTASTSHTILGKLLKLDFTADMEHSKSEGNTENVAKEKIHTNVSLFSKFRQFLIENKAIKYGFDIKTIKNGDFIEIEGKLEKNPLVETLEIVSSFFDLANKLTKKPTVGTKKQVNSQKDSNLEIIKQIEALTNELTNSGTVDFVISGDKGTVILSAQKQYMTNDNISEIIGGSFKVLGKVISVCPDASESIDLLRKTSLSVISDEMLSQLYSGMKNGSTDQFNLPELKTKIPGPAVIVIPIAIFA